MSATALIRFTQGSNTGAAGEALFGVAGESVAVSNSDNVGVVSWQIELLEVPSDSALSTGVLAFAGDDPTPAAAFVPDVSGPYRVQLSIWDVTNRVGAPKDLDIRCFGVKERNGLYVPATQLFPFALPPVESGLTGAKPNENNFGGQPRGWAGTGADGLIAELIKRVDASVFVIPPRVIELSGPATPGGAGPHINCGTFWNASAASSNAQLGSFRATFLVKPTASLLGYVIADGATGGHAQLIGVSPIGTGGLSVEGDFRTDDVAGAFDFNSQACDAIQVDQWALVDVILNQSGVGNFNLFIYLEGVCIFSKECLANRVSAAQGTDGNMYIGGSDHLNFQGRLAFVNLWDCNKLALTGGSAPGGSVFTMANAFRPDNQLIPVHGVDVADFSLDCMSDGALVEDKAQGLYGVAASSVSYRGPTPQHHGVREYSLPAGGREGTPRALPETVFDPDCPGYQNFPRTVANALVASPVSVPVGAKIWADFRGEHQTFYTNEYPKLADTVAGASLGAKTWNVRPESVTNTFVWGTLCGFACFLGEGQTVASPAWVQSNSPNMDVRVQVPIGCDAGRRATYFEGPAVVFRVQDIDNFWVFWVEEDRKGQLRYYSAGVPTDVGGQVTVPANFTWLRAVTSGNSITIYGGTGALGNESWTQVATTTSAQLNAATGAGMSSRGGSKARFQSLAVY